MISFDPFALVITITLLSFLCFVNMAEQINFQYLMKNTPVPHKQEYLLELIHSVREFEKIIKWRAHLLTPRLLDPIRKYLYLIPQNLPPF